MRCKYEYGIFDLPIKQTGTEIIEFFTSLSGDGWEFVERAGLADPAKQSEGGVGNLVRLFRRRRPLWKRVLVYLLKGA